MPDMAFIVPCSSRRSPRPRREGSRLWHSLGAMVLRGATAEDEAFLWGMLLHAAHAGDELDGVEALKAVPELARYVEGWGRQTDLGVVASDGDGRLVGAAWARLIEAYGFID